MMPHSHRIVLGHRYFVISLAFSFLFHVARVLPATTGTDICEIHIGAMMNTVEDMETLQVAVREVNENSRILPGNYRLNVTSIIMTNNPIQSAIRVCEKIIPNEVSNPEYTVTVPGPQPPFRPDPFSGLTPICGPDDSLHFAQSGTLINHTILYPDHSLHFDQIRFPD